jgi:adenylate cyclase
VINDLQATPIAPNVPGVEIHAQLLDQIIGQSFLNRPDWAIGAEILFTLLTGAALILVLPRIGALPSAFLGGASVAAAFATSWVAFAYAGLLIDPIYPWAVLTLVYLVASLIGYLRTEARQREIRSAFSRYMSPHYVEELAAHPERLVLGGEMRVMTIMFCDIRGFTTIAEGMDARTLTHFMNSFLSPMTEIITELKGTIDKYIGDCIMAFWNAPLDDPEHAPNAVRAAQAMRRQLIELNRLWSLEGQAAKRASAVRIGLGINSGECCVGNFGSTQHFDYSLLGDPVNLASRLESLGKLYGIDLVIGEATAEQLDDPALIEVDLVAVKGKSQAGRIYTLLPQGADPGADFVPLHRQLLSAYRRQDWTAAQRLLDDPRLAAMPFFAPVYDLYRRRIAHFRAEPPPADWDGVFVAAEK